MSSVTLPILSGAGGTTAMHIFAMATGTGTPTTGAPYSSLAAAYDNVGITDNSNPAPGNFDGTGESFSAEALAAGTPNAAHPGRPGHVRRDHVHLAQPVGTADDVIADGQTIDMSGSGTDLGFLGAGAFGAASGTGTITYTDGSTQSFSIAMADWYNNAAGRRRRGRHHHDQLELLQQHADAAPGEHLLRLGAAAGGQDRGVGDAAHGEQRCRQRHQRHAHLRDGDRVGHAHYRRLTSADHSGPRSPRAGSRSSD